MNERERSDQAKPRVLIAGGGTGGHVIPALCVADSLSRRGALVEFVGSETGIERELVPAAGYRLYSLPLAGLAGNPLQRARAGLLFFRALLRCRRQLRSFRPAAVLGVGGYASAPAVIAANSLGIPTFVHEQNSVPGKVNRFARRFTREVLVTFPALAEELEGASWVGMPTRKAFFEVSREEALRRLNVEPPVVLVFGGSGGALRINLAAMEAFGRPTPYTVIQISGRRDFPRLSTENPRHRILEYAENMWDHIAAADVVVIRGGAGSLFDTAGVGRASIVIPYPHHRDQQQLLNARYFADEGAAQILPDAEVSAESLRRHVQSLLEDDKRRNKMAERMRVLATPEAADRVAERLLAAGKGGSS